MVLIFDFFLALLTAPSILSLPFVSSSLLWERFVMIPFDGYPGKAFAFFFGYSQPDISFNHGPHLMP
jgi:hypothetical protein